MGAAARREKPADYYAEVVLRPGSNGVIDWELNLFHSDPTLLERSDDDAYERAAALAAALGDPRWLKLLPALTVGEDTAPRAAPWAGLEQAHAEPSPAELALSGL